MSTSLAVREPSGTNRLSMHDMLTLAKHVAAGGLFPGINTPDAALTLLYLAEAEGVHPIQALREYHIIEGRPAIRADALLAKFQAAGGRVRWHETNAQVAKATFTHAFADEPITYSVELADLSKRGVATDRSGELKKNYRSFPAQMLRARLIAEVVRMIAPGLCLGIYVEEEVMDMDPIEKRPERKASSKLTVEVVEAPAAEPSPPITPPSEADSLETDPDPDPDRDPVNGQELIAWLTLQGARHGYDLLGHTKDWAAKLRYSPKIQGWAAIQVTKAVAQAKHMIESLHGDAREEPNNG